MSSQCKTSNSSNNVILGIKCFSNILDPVVNMWDLNSDLGTNWGTLKSIVQPFLFLIIKDQNWFFLQSQSFIWTWFYVQFHKISLYWTQFHQFIEVTFYSSIPINQLIKAQYPGQAPWPTSEVPWTWDWRRLGRDRGWCTQRWSGTLQPGSGSTFKMSAWSVIN